MCTCVRVYVFCVCVEVLYRLRVFMRKSSRPSAHARTLGRGLWDPSQMTVADQSCTHSTPKSVGGPPAGPNKAALLCAPLFCEMRRSSTYSGSGDLRASTGPGPSENLTAPFDHPGLSGARSWSASSLVLGCFLPRKGKAAWMTQALYPPMSFWPPEDQLLHYACTGFYGDEAQSICESTTEEVRELAEPSEEATESDEAMACKVPSSEVLVVAKVPAPRPPPAPRPNTQHPSPPDTPTHPLLPRRIWSGQPYERR